MLIQIDNTVREMTPEEEAEFLASADTDATESDYISALQDLGVEVDG